jgi:hypothetical protein
VNGRFQEEFSRRQKELEEQEFFINMEKKQREVDKLWTNLSAAHV